MQKIADSYYRFNEAKIPSEGVRVDMTVDRVDYEDLDTFVELSGGFAVSGSSRDEFVSELGDLIDKYRIQENKMSLYLVSFSIGSFLYVFASRSDISFFVQYKNFGLISKTYMPKHITYLNFIPMV